MSFLYCEFCSYIVRWSVVECHNVKSFLMSVKLMELITLTQI